MCLLVNKVEVFPTTSLAFDHACTFNWLCSGGSSIVIGFLDFYGRFSGDIPDDIVIAKAKVHSGCGADYESDRSDDTDVAFIEAYELDSGSVGPTGAVAYNGSGDSNVAFGIILAILAIAGISVLLLLRKKQ